MLPDMKCIAIRDELTRGTKDEINDPRHYKLEIKGHEIYAIDIIDEVVKELPGRCAFYRGNSLKYLIRADHKGGLKDLRKAQNYLNREIKFMEQQQENMISDIVKTDRRLP